MTERVSDGAAGLWFSFRLLYDKGMTCETKSKHSRILMARAGLSIIVLFSILGCTSFQGPGELQIRQNLQSTDPAIVLRGDRQTLMHPSEVTFDWPVDKARLTRGFFTRGKRRPHWGVDLAARRGTNIFAAEKGLVVYTGNGFRGYGNLVLIEHGTEWATLYSHLDKIIVKEGQYVAQGDLLGFMGATGNARGVHLHFEIRHQRKPVNPLGLLPQSFITASLPK